MNIIIPYRQEANNGLELRYALRSIEKHLKVEYKDIYIIGDQFPTWLQNVIKIERHEESVKSSRNILNKIRTGLQVAGPVCIQWHDDIYLTQEVSSIPYYYQGNLEQAMAAHHGRYSTIIQNTALKITESIPFFDVHTPIIYKESIFLRLFDYDWSVKQYLVKTMYCNLAYMENIKSSIWSGTKLSQYTDCKISGPQTKTAILNKIAGSVYFSTSPHSLNDDMVEVFESLYPEKSKYEADR